MTQDLSISTYPFGVDYYPEHWPEERWTTDADLMARAGMNTVRLAEFAWSRLEPEEGRVDFGWLDRALEVLQNKGIRAILGTPTASPPPWLMESHPELYRVREDGRPFTYGNRREYCPNQPLYHDFSRRIVSKMAEHYAGHPAVIGWQIDNEFGDRCYCPVCRAAFQGWLRQRYGDLETLNEKWGTVFWSHIYTDWDQIPVPVSTGGSPNPGLGLDFARFSSDSYVAYQQMQVDLLREKCREAGSSQLITHNFMGFGYERLNYFDLARTLDFVAWDNYPRTQWWSSQVVEPAGLGLGHDTMRGLKRKNFWMMEQQAGPGGWEMVSMAPRPGELRLWAYEAIAHGADGMIFFRWRTARFGTEEYWHGLLNHDGSTGRRYEEIKRMGAEIGRAGVQILRSTVKPSAAILLSYDSRFAFQIQGNNPQFTYPQHFSTIYRGLHRRNVPVEITQPGADLSGYRLVIAPTLHVLTEAEAENLRNYVDNGGTLLVTPRSGAKDASNAIVNLPLPGLLSGVCGVEVEEYDSLLADMSNEVGWQIPGREMPDATVNTWCDILRPTTAHAIACYRHDFYAGKPAVTLNRYGKGHAVYSGALGGEVFYDTLAGWLLEIAEIQPGMATPKGVEAAERWQDGKRLLFVLNHSDQEQVIELAESFKNLLDESEVRAGKAHIPAKEVWALVKIEGESQ